MASVSECFVSSGISRAFLSRSPMLSFPQTRFSRSSMLSFQQTRFYRSSMLSFPLTCSPITASVPVCFPQIKQTRSKFEIKSHMGDLYEGRMEDSVELEEKIW
uniref:Uncharacterized protein n=1 Tax=Solanum tuberosum TaxID=4113 RepID=M1BJ43_SOLTU